MNDELPPYWKGLSNDQYDRRINLHEHINMNVTQIVLYTSVDVVLYNIFPISLIRAMPFTIL